GLNDFPRCGFALDGDVFAVAPGQAGFQHWRLLAVEVDLDGPVFLPDESPDLALAFDDQPQRHRLHTSRRQPAPHLVPQQGRDLVAHQPVQHAPRLLGVDKRRVDLAGVVEGPLDGIGGDLVERNPEDLRPAGLFRLQLFLQVGADRLAFAVGVGREVDRAGLLGAALQLVDQLLLAFDDYVGGAEIALHVDRQVVLRQILDVAQAGLDHEVLAQIFADRLRLGGRFDDDQRFWHKDGFRLLEGGWWGQSGAAAAMPAPHPHYT